MNPQDSQLEEQLSIEKSELEMTAKAMTELSPEERPHTGSYLFYAVDNRNVAILSVLLDDIDVACKHFSEMSVGWLAYVDEISEYPDQIAHGGGHKTRPTHACEGLEAAILADDAELVQRGIDACRDLPESYPDEHEPVELYWRARAFAEVVAESDAVDDLLGRYESARYNTKDDGWLDVLHGLHDDAERVTVGLHTLLDEWADETEPDVTDAGTLLDVDTAALYVLARRRGLNVEIDHERFPDQVDELV